MSNPNGLRSQKYVTILTRAEHRMTLLRAAHCMTYFNLSKLTLAEANIVKVFES